MISEEHRYQAHLSEQMQQNDNVCFYDWLKNIDAHNRQKAGCKILLQLENFQNAVHLDAY